MDSSIPPFPPEHAGSFSSLKRDNSESIRVDRPVAEPVAIASLRQLETPHAVVDGARLHHNIDRVAQYARDHQLALRPHAKTHKDPAVGALQLEAGAQGLTVATTREAEVMATVCKDVLVAFPPVDPGRIDRLLEIPATTRLSIALDSKEALRLLQARAKKRGLEGKLGIFVEIDLGGKRTGVQNPQDACAIALDAHQDELTEFKGILVFFGHIDARPQAANEATTDGAKAGLSISQQLAGVSARLEEYLAHFRARGIACPIVSGGSTPTLFSSHLIPELTEIRPGSYVYCDRDIASQGSFEWDDCAYSILATVISVAVPHQAVVDAGAKTVGREPLPGLPGFGALFDRPEVVLKEMSEEHGILDLSKTDWKPRVGDRVRIIPNHVCISVHLQDRIAFAESGELTLRDVAARGR